MTALAFAFINQGRTPLRFAWPISSPIPRLRNPRYRWVAPPLISPRICGGRYSRPEMPPIWSGIATQVGVRYARPPLWSGIATACGGRWIVPPVPFIGEILPKNVRAAGMSLPWMPAVSALYDLRNPWSGSALASVVPAIRLAPAAERAADCTFPVGNTPLTINALASGLQEANGQTRSVFMPYGHTPLGTQASAAAWRDSAPQGHLDALVWMRAYLRTRDYALPWRESRPQVTEIGVPCATAVLLENRRTGRFPWHDSRPTAGLSWPWRPLPPIPQPPLRPPLRFHFLPPLRARLTFHFGREPAWVLPIRRSYRMPHTLSLVRLPDRTPIPVSAMTLTSAWDEWTWTLNASPVGAQALDLLRPVVSQPVEVEASVDGYVWGFRLDQVSGSTAFHQASGQTQGRGRVALLGPEVALAVNGYETEAMTARQLAEQELTGTDWQLDWGIVDWLVPARRFSYTAKTPIEVIQTLAEVAGGRILADPADAILRALPRYPLPPWQWAGATPDVVLPRDLLLTLAWKPRHGLPWDALYLGDGVDVLAKVVRTGLPGTSLPETPTVEPLLCHLDVCRARGIAALAAVYAGVDFTLALPVSALAGPSPLRAVGELVRFADGGKVWVGLITSVSIRVGFGTVMQTLEVQAIEVPT
jgi:hypothetical protein